MRVEKQGGLVLLGYTQSLTALYKALTEWHSVYCISVWNYVTLIVVLKSFLGAI